MSQYKSGRRKPVSKNKPMELIRRVATLTALLCLLTVSAAQANEKMRTPKEITEDERMAVLVLVGAAALIGTIYMIHKMSFSGSLPEECKRQILRIKEPKIGRYKFRLGLLPPKTDSRGTHFPEKDKGYSAGIKVTIDF